MKHKKAYLAGGCFWGLEDLFRNLRGVISTEVGYSGGRNKMPTYDFHPGHAEALEVIYNSEMISYKELLDFFFRVHDPTTKNQQGNDRGSSYRSAIFFQNAEEKKVAEDFVNIVNRSKRWNDPVATTLEKFEHFWMAEDYHQDYLEKNPGGYTCHYIRFDSYL